MKVSGIDPFTGPQQTDIDRSDEVEFAGLNQPSDSPVAELDSGSEPSEHGQPNDGLIRLLDFLARKQAEKRREKKASKLEKGLSSYQRLLDDGVEYLGTKFNRRF